MANILLSALGNPSGFRSQQAQDSFAPALVRFDESNVHAAYHESRLEWVETPGNGAITLAAVAQPVEHQVEALSVLGATPSVSTNCGVPVAGNDPRKGSTESELSTASCSRAWQYIAGWKGLLPLNATV